jgi:NADPH:quinone reductase
MQGAFAFGSKEMTMKAVCVRPDRSLEVREISTPAAPPAGHVLVQIEASAINHGDKIFLARKPPINLPATANDVWGASAAGRVIAIGEGVSTSYIGKPVAVYLSMRRTSDTIGLWCEVAQVHHLNCMILPDEVQPSDYCGSLVNAITAYAFLAQAQEEGHKGIVATAGHSATGRALAALARGTGVPVIHLVRSASAREALREMGIEHVLVTTEQGFEQTFAELANRLNATAVFDGLGGDIVSRLAPHVPRNATFYFYGFLVAGVPFSIETQVFMHKNMTMKFFSNFQTATVTDSGKLVAALDDLHRRIADPLFRTRPGRTFAFDEIDAAMRYTDADGGRPVITT